MAQTSHMRADEIANGFNGVTERKYWRASIAGTRVNPEVHFNSRASMVRVSYSITTGDFTVSFSKTSAAFGDFLASAFRSMDQILTCLMAAGLPFVAPVDETAALRVEYSPRSKTAVVSLARQGDDWRTAQPTPFKVPERKSDELAFSGVDAL